MLKRVAIFFFILFAASSVEAAELAIGNEKLEFNPGQQYCQLNESTSEFDRLMLEWQRKANQEVNFLVGIFIECAKLPAMRTGEHYEGVARYGIVLAPLFNGKLSKVPGYAQTNFLDELAGAVEEGFSIDATEIEKKIRDALDPEIRKELGELSVSGFQNLGIIHRDEVAIYNGMVLKTRAGEVEATIAAVIGQTLVKGYMVSYNLYRELIDESTFHILLSEIRPVMQQLILSNEIVEE